MGRRRTTFLRVLVIFLVLAVVGVAALTVIVRHRFPPEEVGRLLSDFLTSKTGYTVHISRVHFNLLRGFEIEDLRLLAPRPGANTPLDSVHVKRVTLRYSLSQLLHRVLRIHAVDVDEPYAWLTLKPARQQDTTGAPVTGHERQFRERSSLPVSVDLKRLIVRDFGLSARLNQPKRSADIRTASWSLELSGLSLDRDNGTPTFQQFSVHHPEDNLRVRFRSDTLRLSALLPTRFELTLSGKQLPDTVQLNLFLSLKGGPLRLQSPHRRVTVHRLPQLLKLNASGTVTGLLPQTADSLDSLAQPGQRASVHADFPAVALRFLGSTAFNGDFHATVDSTGQRFALSLGDGAFPVAAWFQIARQALPEVTAALDSASFHNTSFGLSFLELQGSGQKSAAESLSVSLAGFVTAPRFLYPPSQAAVESLRTDFDLAGTLTSSGVRSLDVHALTLANSLVAQTGTRFVSLNNVTFDVGTTLDSTLWLHTADLDFEIDDALGGTAFVRSHWFTPGKHASLRGEIRSQLRSLQVSTLTDQPLHGRLDFQSTVRVPGDGSVRAMATWVADSLVLETPEQPIAFPALRGQFKGSGRFDPETRRASLRGWQLWLPSFLLAQGDLQVVRDSVHVALRRFRTQPGKIVDWAQPLLPETSADIELGGTVSGSATVSFSPRQSAVAGSLSVANGLFAQPSSEFAAGQIDFRSAYSGTFDSLSLSGSGQLDSLWLGSFGRRPLQHTAFDVEATVLPGRALIRLDTVKARHTPLGLLALGHGQISTANPDTQVVRLEYTFSVAADSFGPLGDVARLRGRAEGRGSVLMLGDLLHVDGTVQPRTLCARLASGVELDTVAGKIRYDFWLDLAGEEPVFLSKNPEVFPNRLREIQYTNWRSLAPPADTLYVRHIRFLRYRLEGLHADVLARNGFVYIPSFRVNAYGGAVGGRVLLDYRNRTSLTGAFEADVQISRLNTALLNPARKGKTSYVTGTIRLRGQGFTPESLANVRGLVQFTELGPTVADDILASLDPSGLNPGIRNTRRLLALGFRPLQMSFQLRQGYFYPSLKLKQPWFSPVRLSGGRIDMGRLPLEPFLRTAQTGGLSP